MHTAIAIFDDSKRLQRALDRVFEAGIAHEDVHVVEGTPTDQSGESLSPGRGNQDPELARANRELSGGEDDARVGMARGSAGDTGATPGETHFATTGPVGPFVAPGSTAGTPAPALHLGPLADSLRGFGIDDEEARFFEERLQKGDAHLLAVRVREGDSSRIYDIFRQAGAGQTNDPND